MIGVFDSGFGGLTVLRSILRLLPQYDYLYVGDNARAPYGNRSHEAVKQFTEEGVKYLFGQGCQLIIIACNTASSQVLRELQEEYLRTPGITDKKILGVIRPLVEKAVKITKNGRVGVVGTRGTIGTQSYNKELTHLEPKLQVFGQACPLLVPLIEENWIDKPETRMILKKYLRGLKSRNVDTLLLACTHYPFLLRDFRRMMGKNVQIPDPGDVVAESLSDYLNRHPEIEKQLSKKGTRHFVTTDDPERFRVVGGPFLGMDLKMVEKVRL